MSGEYRITALGSEPRHHVVTRDGDWVASFETIDDARAFAAMKNGEVPEKYARLVEACKDFDLLCERDGWGDAPRDWRKVQSALAAVEGKR